jgi:hypothetical protein
MGEWTFTGRETAVRIEHAAGELIGLHQNSGQFAKADLACAVLDGPQKARKARSQHDQV